MRHQAFSHRPFTIERHLKVLKKLPAVDAESAKTALSRSTRIEGAKELMFDRFWEQWFSEVSTPSGVAE